MTRVALGRSTLACLTLVAVAALWPGGEAYGQTTDEMNISIEIVEACEVAAEDLDFGEGSYIDRNHTLRMESTITVTCADNVLYEIGISHGDNYDGARHLSGDGGDIAYHLYDAENEVLWGDGSDTPGKFDRGNGLPQDHTVLGTATLWEIFPLPPGEYTDTVVVSIDV